MVEAAVAAREEEARRQVAAAQAQAQQVSSTRAGPRSGLCGTEGASSGLVPSSNRSNRSVQAAVPCGSMGVAGLTFVTVAVVCGAQAHDAAVRAQERAAAAEQAKIELTLALAEAAEARARDVDTHLESTPPPAADASGSSSSGARRRSSTAGAGAAADGTSREGEPSEVSAGGGGSSTRIAVAELEALMNRAEEARLAAAVQTRRAAAAEAELDGLRKRLADAEKQVKDLGWQLQMVTGMDPVTVGGKGGPGGAGGAGGRAGWFGDMLGCGANFVRK